MLRSTPTSTPRSTPTSATSFRALLIATLATPLLLLAGCSAVPTPAPAAATAVHLAGQVHGGQQPVTGSTLQLYAAGSTADGASSTPLILTTYTTSDGSGQPNANANAGNTLNTLPAGYFNITNAFICPVANPATNVYLVAHGGNPGFATPTNNAALVMMAALGPCNGLTSSTSISIDELTTVGAVAALFPYATSYAAIGSGTADAAAFSSAFTSVSKYVNNASGTAPGPTLPASTYASTYELTTLGDAIVPCINSNGSGSPCALLFGYTTPPSNIVPTDTFGALLDVLNNPTRNVCSIYGLVPALPPFQPTLSACPATFALPISTISIALSATSTTPYAGATDQFTATVTGVTNQGVTWAVNGINGGNPTVGTISTTGLYTAPITSPGSAVSVTATSVLSSTAVGNLSITVTPVTVTLTGPADILFAQTGQYTATVTGNATQTVTWAVNGVAGGSTAEGTISATGLYTAPASTPTTPVVITAQSTAVSSATGTLAISVSPTALSYATGDSRTVTQPTNPAICATLTAQFATSQRSTPPAAASDDTTRIQAALTSSACKNTGKAVELSIAGSNNAFFSELLNVTGEGLLIDSGVTLYGGTTYSSQAELLNITGTNSTLTGPGIIDGRGDLITASMSGSTTRLVQTNTANNFIAYNITLQQSIYPNLYIQSGNGATVWGVTILTPANRANADGIDIDSITNVTVINSTVESGDDGIAVKTNASAASNITVANSRFYGGHGLSIGSQTFKGVTNVLFTGNYVYGTDLTDSQVSGNNNGINIKTDPTCGGSIQQVTYQNTCLLGVKHLIILNTMYGTCSGTAGTPVFTNVIVNGVLAQSSQSSAYSQVTGYSAANPSSAFLANIQLDNNSLNTSSGQLTQYTAVSLENSTLTPTGTGITTNTFSTPGSVPTCSF